MVLAVSNLDRLFVYWEPRAAARALKAELTFLQVKWTPEMDATRSNATCVIKTLLTVYFLLAILLEHFGDIDITF